MTHLEETVRSIEQQVAVVGWDAPPKLYALVETAELLRQQPDLAKTFGLDGTEPITAVDQGELPDESISDTLAGILWPDTVVGCALAMVRITLPPEVEDQIPAGSEALAWAAAHPLHEELRIVVGVLRDGTQHAVLRIRRHEEDLISAEDLFPDLSAALAQTLLPEE